jgi:hypothetical protein
MRRVILRSIYHPLLNSNDAVCCRGGPNREINHFTHNHFAQAIFVGTSIKFTPIAFLLTWLQDRFIGRRNTIRRFWLRYPS